MAAKRHPEQTTQLQLRISPSLKQVIERAARADRRSMSDWVRLMVERAAVATLTENPDRRRTAAV